MDSTWQKLARNARSHVLDHGEGGQDQGRQEFWFCDLELAARIAWATRGGNVICGTCAEQGQR